MRADRPMATVKSLIHSEVLAGLSQAGIPRDKLEEVEEGISESGQLSAAAKKFGLNWLQSQLKTEFTILETIAMSETFRAPPELFLLDGRANPQYWTYRGEDHRRGMDRLHFDLVIGTFNKALSMDGALEWAEANGYKGSGAWIRRLYVILNPDYDGKGPLLFPSRDSVWQSTETQAMHGPGLWHDNGSAGRESLEPMSNSQRPGRRFAFVVNEEVSPQIKLHVVK